jgi:VIT1/CCC1 family predicted Fe2+/Mn2+ transporter
MLGQISRILAYKFGGLIPLIPYMVLNSASNALYTSLAITLFTLFVFGYVKGRILGVPNAWLSGLQMAFVGGAAAGSAFGIASAIPSPDLQTKPINA